SEELKKNNIYTASVTGKGIKTTNINVDSDFNSVLCAFSPFSKMKNVREITTAKMAMAIISHIIAAIIDILSFFIYSHSFLC
ncbi:MAG: hypothetical protein RSA79_04340, partial [Oscillospiraceae bacterium]